MKRLILFALLLFVGMDVYAQGSAPSPPQLWRRKGTADTSFVVIKTGDSVFIYDTAAFTKFDIRGANTSWLIPDSIKTVTLTATSKLLSSNVLEITGSGFIMNTFAQGPDTIFSLIGNGLEVTNGYLTVTLGASIEGSEITNQTITKSDIDTTAVFTAARWAIGSSASTDNDAQPKHYIDSFLFGYPKSGSPSGGSVPVYDDGLSAWTFGSGGSGSGDNARIDQTLDNSDYVVGSTTYTGGFWDVSTYTMRGDTGINIIKSGAHPGDTAIFRPDWARIQRNDGTQSIRTFRTTSGDTLLVMQDSSIYTKMTTSNSGGWKFEAPLHIDNNLILDGSNRSISGVWLMYGPDDSQPLYIGDSSSLNLQTTYTNKPVVIGSSSNWTLRADTLRGAGNGDIFGLKRVISDTIVPLRIRQEAGSTFIVTSTDTTLKVVRDTANDTTTMTANGKFKFTADAGLTEMDSVALHGRLRMYDGTNKSRIDSASGISADTLKTLPGGFVKFYGGTSGFMAFKASPTTTSDTVIWPKALSGVANSALIDTTGNGDLKWVAGGAGSGNGSADFDTVASRDTNVLKSSGDSVLWAFYEDASHNAVMSPGNGKNAGIIGDSSGIVAIDTALLVYSYSSHGHAVNDISRLDSGRIVNAIRLNRYYFKATDLYWSPEKARVADSRFLTWNMCDTAATWPNNSQTAILYDLVDSTGDSKRPLNHTWFATERDSLFSLVWNYKTDSAAFVGSTDTSVIGYPEYAILWKNGTQIDSVFIGKGKASLATDSINFADVAVAPGDVMTAMVWFNSKGGTSTKRLRVAWAYLNMRRY